MAALEDDWAGLERLDEEAAGSDAAPDEPDDPYEQLEAEAAALLGALPDDPEAAAKPLIDKLRRQLAGRARSEQAAYDRGRQEALAEVKAQAARHEALDRLAVPRPLRALFDGTDLGDENAVTAKLDELRAGGVSWGQPGQATAPQAQPGQAPAAATPAPTEAQPDPGQIVSIFQRAAAAGVPGPAGDVLSRVAQGGAGAISSPQDGQAFEQQLNDQIAAMGQRPGAGMLG